MDYTSSNPAFGNKTWERVGSMSSTQGHATIQGSINKTMILLACLLLTAGVSWNMGPGLATSGILFPVVIVTAIVQLILTFMIVRAPERAKTLGIIYALIEGVVLGALSYLFESLYSGIVMQAILGTAGVIGGMLFIYKTRIIRVTENFKLIVAAATMGVAFLYLVSFILSFFGKNVPFIHDNGPYGIAFSVLVIGIAAFNLAVDFDFIEKCEERRAPVHMEWYGAFGLMITIIWIYIEILRLLAKSRSRK